jgi:hypothetical protein
MSHEIATIPNTLFQFGQFSLPVQIYQAHVNIVPVSTEMLEAILGSKEEKHSKFLFIIETFGIHPMNAKAQGDLFCQLLAEDSSHETALKVLHVPIIGATFRVNGLHVIHHFDVIIPHNAAVAVVVAVSKVLIYTLVAKATKTLVAKATKILVGPPMLFAVSKVGNDKKILTETVRLHHLLLFFVILFAIVTGSQQRCFVSQNLQRLNNLGVLKVPGLATA